MRPQPLPRGREIGKRLAMGVAMNVLQPGKCRVLDCIKLFFERARVRMAARQPLPVPLGQRPVPDKAGRATRLLKVCRLLRRRVQPNSVG